MKNIRMNVEMTKAILDGQKVQTRRVFKDEEIIDTFLKNGGELNKIWVIDKHSKYQIGETIWVREPAKVINVINYGYKRPDIYCKYLADEKIVKLEIPSRFYYPKWIRNKQGIPNGCIKEMASIFLKITDVRVERLQDISYESIMDEGCDLDISTLYDGCGSQAENIEYNLVKWWKDLWNKTAPKGYKYLDNPYCFVYTFEVIDTED